MKAITFDTLIEPFSKSVYDSMSYKIYCKMWYGIKSPLEQQLWVVTEEQHRPTSRLPIGTIIKYRMYKRITRK